MNIRYCLLPLILCLGLTAFGQTRNELRPLVPGQPVEREISGGQSHTYQVKLASGQFVRVVVEQKGIDVALTLTSPDGKQLIENDVTGIFSARAPLSYEATAAGTYQITIRANRAATQSGAYQVWLELKASASSPDRKRMAAELLLRESRGLLMQGRYADPQLSEKLGHALALWRELDDRYWQGFTLNVIGLSQYGASQFDKAIEPYEQALSLWREEKLRAGEASVLSNLGNAYLGLKRTDKASESFEQALMLHRELKDRAGEGNALNDAGTSYYRMNRYEKAIEYYEPALQISRELKDRVNEGLRLNNLGNAYGGLSRNDKAVEYYEQALVIRRELKDRSGEATSLSDLGSAYERLSRYEKSLEYYQQTLAINQELKNRHAEGVNLSDIGWLNGRLGRYDKAAGYGEQALLIAREVKNRNDEGLAINSLANAYSGLKQFEKAIEYGEQYLALVRELKSRAGEASALNNLANYYQNLFRFEKSIEYFEQALTLFRELKDRQAEALAFRNLGDLYTRLTRLDKAVESYELALPIYREIKDRQGEAFVLGPMANVYNLLGRSEKSIEYFQLALPINREFKNHYREANNFNGLGNAYVQLHQYEKAVEFYEQALAITREYKLRALEGTMLGNLGEAYFALDRFDKAIEYSQQALVISRETKNRSNETFVLAILGNALRAQGQYQQATRQHEQALSIAREVRSRGREAEALLDLRQDWQARQQPNLAIFFGKQAVNLYQTIRGEIVTLERESQQSFIKSKEDTYRALADLLIAQGRLPEAEQVIRMLKEEEYFEYIRRDSTNAPQGQKAQLTPEEAALEKRYREIADQLASIGTERGTLMEKKSRTPEEEQRLARLDADLVVAGNAFQKFLSQLETDLGTSSEANAKAFALRESQGLMEDLRELGNGVVALYTLVGEDKYRVILTTADFQKGYEYPIKAADLNRKVLEFREALQNPKFDPLPLAQELYKILLGPVAKDLAKAKVQTIMWSLDGVLRYVPVSALNDGQHYLVEQYQNVVFTPASQARLKDVPSRNWNALGLGVTKAHGDRIPALPGVADEMHGIIREAGAGEQSGVLPGTIKLDEAFTQESMLAGLRQRPPVVHVASHFQFSPGNETNSALLLGDGSFLSLAQIKSLPNVFGGVELLTLSACNTATGGSGANGKEVEGFGVLAQRQGAKAVVASLWPVADRSTKLLMQEFYRAREARNGESKIAALREAQLKLLRGQITVDATQSPSRQITHEDAKPEDAKRPLFKLDPKAPFAHPYYWAPFILIGNWK